MSPAVHVPVDAWSSSNPDLSAPCTILFGYCAIPDVSASCALESTGFCNKLQIPVIAGLVLGRKLIWFHHILSTAKRKAIVSWSAKLEIGGFSKPGYPGVLIIEGMRLWPAASTQVVSSTIGPVQSCSGKPQQRGFPVVHISHP